LFGLLDSLPPQRRAVVVLRFYCDLTVAQTAAALGIPVGTVKTQSARGLAALRVLAEQRDPR
ncbi:MAG TPA: sigma factor-like helix-turn-helix DNA-binding protein, partial [Pilimelia sp.]|nr:sigma factor-like helix-turn-helix DNA-binding protein [Pilimelia sp.]